MSPKAQKFVQEYLIDLNASAAAVRAGYRSKRPDALAWDLLRKPEIAAAVAKAKAEAAERAGLTVDIHMANLERISAAAFAAGQYGPATTAEMARGKVSGFYVDRVEMDANVRGSVEYKANIPRRIA